MKGEKRMSEELTEALPVAAEVAVHPSGELLIWVNDSISPENQVKFSLACAQAFIGYAGGILDKPKPNIAVPQMQVVKL